jgi:hypothetical protein
MTMTMQIIVEDHIERTIAKVPRDQLQTLAAGLLQRVVVHDGIDVLFAMFGIIAENWEPPRSLKS